VPKCLRDNRWQLIKSQWPPVGRAALPSDSRGQEWTRVA
jgi:hypothetical protein